MKKLLVTLAMILSAGWAQAELPAGYSKVPSSKVNEYNKAVRAAIAQNPQVIQNCNADWINYVLTQTDEILVQSQSAQPLLLMDAYDQTQFNEVLARMEITTDASLKVITKVVAEVYRMGEVNKGDLAHPVIVQDYVLQNRTSCTPGYVN
jgi:hypothetical protein